MGSQIFKPNGFYTHHKLKDVFIYVVKVKRLSSSSITLCVMWLHRTYQDFGHLDTIEVKKKDYSAWYEYFSYKNRTEKYKVSP